ncbi:uncharacterized protein F4807DRAFT_410895 [Annulohypoxylon truncatum]|uniref:uncharacterized protein n=1 Tax=Annulohypoxylon truncatum TaxID=327061 RepID=UPI002008E313|nr:uncharacterized protein F4807DRAFT_410895 [Annulohypoxylon truncatum]KAI1213381.1 hypothetical protein F4807DRAFT_410895 [Annulohypoxylon truncatum]
MASPELDLSIPHAEPALVRDLHECSTQESSIALYTMVPNMPNSRLEEIASKHQGDWESQFEQSSQLVRPARPTANFAGQTLRDIINAHIAMDKELQPAEEGAASAGWRPESFIVVTKDDLEDHGLLFVYAQLEDGDEDDDEEDKTAEGEMGKFFFRPDDMFEMLFELTLESYGYPDLEEKYNMDGEGGDGDGDDE